MSREREVEVPRGPGRIRVMVVGDVRLYREGIAATLAHRDDLAVVCTANRIDDVIRLKDCDPDVIVLDMSTRGSLELLERITSSGSRARVVTLSLQETEHDIVRYAQAGAAGYAVRDGRLEDLANTIRAVAQGERLDADVRADADRSLTERAPLATPFRSEELGRSL